MDEAFERVRLWAQSLQQWTRKLSEADTRAKLIDPVFRDALGWPEDEIIREEPVVDGFVDYTFGSSDKIYFLVEAKRERESFGLAPGKVRPYVYSGPGLSRVARTALLQASNYAAQLGCAVAVATNGHEYLLVRAISETPLRQRKVIAIPDIAKPEQFRALVDLLGCAHVKAGGLAEALLELSRSPIREIPRNRLSQPDRELNRNKLWSVLGHLATHILEDRPESRIEIIENCYVRTTESSETDRVLKSLVEKLPARLVRETGGTRALSSDGKGLGRSLEAAVKDRRSGVYVLTGGAGCGKTTFLSRFQHVVEPKLVANYCAWFYVDFLASGKSARASQDVESFLFRRIRHQLDVLYGAQIATDPEGLRHLFRRELETLKKTALYGLNPRSLEYKKRANEEVHRLHADDKSFCRAAIDRLREMGRRPVFVLDNSDQLGEDFQEQAFLNAKALQDLFAAICIVSLREEKFYAAYYRGVFNAFPTHKFYIGSPDLREVLRARIDYGIKLLRENPAAYWPSSTASSPREDALQLQDCIDLLAIFSRSMVTRNRNNVRLMESVSAGNIRFGLELFRDFVGSANTDISEVLRIWREDGAYTVPFHQFAKSVMLRNREFYHSGDSPLINVFAVSSAPRASHFTTLRILRYLHDRANSPSPHGNGFVDFRLAREEYHHALDAGKDFDQTISHLIQKGLIEAEPPRNVETEKVLAIKLGASGSYYLRYLCQAFAYLDLVAIDTPLSDEKLVSYLVSVASTKDISIRIERVRRFMGYLIEHEEREISLMPLNSPFRPALMPAIAQQVQAEVKVVRQKSARRRHRREGEHDSLGGSHFGQVDRPEREHHATASGEQDV